MASFLFTLCIRVLYNISNERIVSYWKLFENDCFTTYLKEKKKSSFFVIVSSIHKFTISRGSCKRKTVFFKYVEIFCVRDSFPQSCPTLEIPWVSSPQGSSIHGISQAKILGGLPFPPPGDLPNSETEPISSEAPALASRFFLTDEPPGKPHVEILLAIISTHSVLLHLL